MVLPSDCDDTQGLGYRAAARAAARCYICTNRST